VTRWHKIKDEYERWQANNKVRRLLHEAGVHDKLKAEGLRFDGWTVWEEVIEPTIAVIHTDYWGTRGPDMKPMVAQAA